MTDDKRELASIDDTFRFLDVIDKAYGTPSPQEIADEFSVQDAAARLDGEEDERAELTARSMSYHVGFLDDVLRGLLPHDLVLIGADTGIGKTQLALHIAAANAMQGRRVVYFALEAEPREMERRLKFRHLADLCARADIRGLSYVDWYLGRIPEKARNLEKIAHRIASENYATLRTFYRGADSFGLDGIRRHFTRLRNEADLLVLDHLHYVDIDDANEMRGLKQAVKTIRDTALQIGRPVIVVAHLRKRDRNRGPVPELEDFHGSSDLTKIATHAIMLARAPRHISDEQSVAPTYMHVPKDRRGGATGLVARIDFDLRAQRYSGTYQLGRIAGDEWEPLQGDAPRWATGHRTRISEAM